ncbi:MAG: LLM class flavin-dependent oxidoreductase [Candidatus Helarchaeota archaeon]|nr:LLM class flavin-dependent oxidoreductase [Candidatus Helarchaeota archaeon]
MVKFGVQHGTNSALLDHNIEAILESIQAAEKLGYDSAFVMDHLNMFPRRSEVYDAWTLLGAIAGKTNNMQIGSCVSDPHRYHPAVLAQKVATVSRLSNGRAILSLGYGEGMNLNTFGIPFGAKPVTKLRESIQIIRLLWNSTPKSRVNFEGLNYSINEAFLQIKIHNPCIWVAGNSPMTLKVVAELGDGWIPTGYSPKLYKKHLKILNSDQVHREIEKAYEIFIAISRTREKAENIMQPIGATICLKKELLSEYNVELPEELQFQKRIKLSLYEMMKDGQKLSSFISQIPLELIQQVTAYGTPDDCIESIDRFVKAGVDHFVIEFLGPNYYDAMTLFMNEVIPHFK